jgi:hypothetical protein
MSDADLVRGIQAMLIRYPDESMSQELTQLQSGGTCPSTRAYVHRMLLSLWDRVEYHVDASWNVAVSDDDEDEEDVP